MENGIGSIFSEYRAARANIEIEIESLKQDIKPFLQGLVLYGAGSAGIAFLKYLQRASIFPAFFSDGNPAKWGTQCEGLEIIAPQAITERAGKDALVIVCINTDGKRYCKSFSEELRREGHSGVHRILKDVGCRHVVDYTYFRRCHELFRGDAYNLPSCSDIFLMEEHEEDIARVYERLGDGQSKEVFAKILRFRMVDDSIEVPTLSQERQYFEYNLYPKLEDEIFVDCGAYNGISLKTFLEVNNNRFGKYYGFEPDKENYASLLEYTASMDDEIKKKLTLSDCAVSDHNGTAFLYALHGPGSFMSDAGTESVPVVTIDSALSGGAATYIKMNIEGMELKALQGARRTVCSFKPRLAIAGYHKTWDLWEIPSLIHSFRDDYQIYLRSYMNHLSFVYYAV